MTTLTLKKRRAKSEPPTQQSAAPTEEAKLPERLLLKPSDIQHEIERLMARPVGFESQRWYDKEANVWFTDFRFVCDGIWGQARVTDDDRALSADEFSTRIVGPLVTRWRMARWRRV